MAINNKKKYISIIIIIKIVWVSPFPATVRYGIQAFKKV